MATYFLYQNWRAKKKSSPVLHNATCKNCNYGSGKLSKSNPGKNGVWIGPFTSVSLSKDYVTKIINGNIKYCSFCILATQ